MTNKWDGFSAFDSEKWDMKYQKGKYAPDLSQQRALKIVAVGLVAILGCLLWDKFKPHNKRVYYGEEHTKEQQRQWQHEDEEAPRHRRRYHSGYVLR